MKREQKTGRSPLRVGNRVLIRTITHYYTGAIVLVTDQEIVLEMAAWVANTGRWSAALATGSLEEVEPFVDPVSIMRGSVVDVTTWRHALPVETRP